jgi:uncharacterized repeat protein (TIGR02543 family)
MKNPKLLLFILTGQLLASGLAAQTADGLVSAGRACLVAHNLTGAYSNFNAAVTLSPTNEAANALAAVTRLLVLPQQPAGSNFLNSLKLSTGGRDIYNWTSTFPHDINGHTMLPTNNTSVAIAFYRTNIMAALAASRTNLAQITDPNFTLSLTAAETSIESVTVDYGDFLLMQALERAAEFAGYTLTTHNFNFVFSHLQDLDKTNGLTIQRVLSDYPSLLNLANTTDLATSKGIFTNAIILYQQASDFIRNIRPPGAVRLFNLEPDDLAKEATFRALLTNVLLSLNTPTELSPSNANAIASTAYFGAYFSGAHSLRSLIPRFNGNAYVNNTLPDYTFGGIVPDWPAYETEAGLRKMFYSYAGIYAGQVYDITFGDPDAGVFGVGVSTNGQATVVGYDVDSFQNIDGSQSGGVAAQFNVDPHGNWQFNSNSVAGVSGYGSVSKDGSFSGELDFTNGDSVQLNGIQQSPLGPFQNAAGGYSGTWSGTDKGQPISGSLIAGLSANGYIVFCIFHNGAQNDGGLGQFGSNNQFTTTDTASGATISGTLTNATLKIGGTFNNSGASASGTFTLTRSASVPFDVPPAITTPPQNKNVTAGSNVTFSVTATGSAPLCYQWYCNDTLILGATSTSLVVTNAPLSASGNSYSVSINNVVGGTNATANLIVVPETVKPTVQITAPTPGLQVSNANYTVTGTAGDNVGVSNVFYSLNGSGWAAASTANAWSNWTAQVTLVPGTNTIQACAMDTAGNFSTTNKASLVYILSAPLTVSTNGNGTISPNYNGALLQIGANYSMTATASAGFGFTGWTGSSTTNGATLKFIMASNLTFTANFVDTGRPTNGISSPTANQHWSNEVFTVSGKASDNVAVANVFYSLNGSGWAPAVTANNWSNWTAQVTLVPGTNTIQAYAMDTAGNFSTTNKASLVYILSAPLTVSTNGNGTISPNYNGALLQIGANYSMTATASAGFGFTGWTGSSTTNGATLKFVMASNLTFTANFVDTARPTNGISSPTANQHWSNAVFTVTGKAGDNVSVANVFYSLNGSGWAPAVTANNWSNWTAQVTLVPGTNTVQAYAVDTAGNFSTTNKASLVYILSAPLTVSTNGNGTISPNYNGALLQIGANYSMTATASAGFGFTGWTGSSTTNGATLKFIMASNLTFTANFVDTAKPTNGISSPTANQHWSNEVFTVTGKAGDNVSVANVFYSLNGSGWAAASTANAWSNWTAQVTLVPGTNTIQACAVDTVGNFSTTNKASLVYILSAPLTVSTNGNGTISPNYNGALLQIGSTYTMTATASAGFGFTGWTGSSTTNGATLKFTMASNLTFTANFVDTNRPTVSITNLASGQRVSNAVFTVKGTASDNVQVSNVWYQLNGMAWSNALTANGWTNWTAQVTLVPGTNTIQAYAVDTAGNFSTTNKASLVYILSAPLTVSINGNGTISPNYNGALLQIGSTYTMTATASAGFGFTGWTGSSTTNGATLKFVMASNLTFTANFSPIVSCTYTFSATSTNVAAGTASGSFNVTTASGCAWTATSGSSWIHTSSAGTGSGTVSYTVDANTATNSRTGTMTISGHTFTVTQAKSTGGGVWPSEGIIFVRWSDDSWTDGIWVMNTDGSNPRRLSSVTKEYSGDHYPSSSPDGAKIVFARDGTGIVVLDNTGEIIVKGSGGGDVMPKFTTWSYNGKIYFTGWDTTYQHEYIYSINQDGTGETQVSPVYISEATPVDYHPSVSPDGLNLLFDTDRTGCGGIAKIAIGSGSFIYLTVLTCGNDPIIYPEHPTWSPDGSKIAFAGSPNYLNSVGKEQIYVMNADGSGKVQLTSETGADCRYPSWSPDGSKIVFQKDYPSFSNPYEIWIMNADGSGGIALTDRNVTADEQPCFIKKPR